MNKLLFLFLIIFQVGAVRSDVLQLELTELTMPDNEWYNWGYFIGSCESCAKWGPEVYNKAILSAVWRSDINNGKNHIWVYGIGNLSSVKVGVPIYSQKLMMAARIFKQYSVNNCMDIEIVSGTIYPPSASGRTTISLTFEGRRTRETICGPFTKLYLPVVYNG